MRNQDLAWWRRKSGAFTHHRSASSSAHYSHSEDGQLNVTHANPHPHRTGRALRPSDNKVGGALSGQGAWLYLQARHH